MSTPMGRLSLASSWLLLWSLSIGSSGQRGTTDPPEGRGKGQPKSLRLPPLTAADGMWRSKQIGSFEAGSLLLTTKFFSLYIYSFLPQSWAMSPMRGFAAPAFENASRELLNMKVFIGTSWQRPQQILIKEQ